MAVKPNLSLSNHPKRSIEIGIKLRERQNEHIRTQISTSHSTSFHSGMILSLTLSLSKFVNFLIYSYSRTKKKRCWPFSMGWNLCRRMCKRRVKRIALRWYMPCMVYVFAATTKTLAAEDAPTPTNKNTRRIKQANVFQQTNNEGNPRALA